MSALIISVEYCTYNVALITVWEHAWYYSGLNKKNISSKVVVIIYINFPSNYNLEGKYKIEGNKITLGIKKEIVVSTIELVNLYRLTYYFDSSYKDCNFCFEFK